MEDQLRQAIRESGMPQNRISRVAKMDEGTLSCFMLRKQESVRLKTAQRLAGVLGLQLVLEPKADSKAKGARKTKKVVKRATKSKTRAKRAR